MNDPRSVEQIESPVGIQTNYSSKQLQEQLEKIFRALNEKFSD